MLVEHASPEEWNSSIFASVKPNDYEIGKTLAEELLKDYSGDISGKKIGILSETQKSESIIQREKGFRDGLKGAGAEMNWSVSISLREDKEEYLSNQAKVDLVIALDDNSLRTAGQCATARKLRGALIYGVGSSTEAIYYLDTGIVECLVVPDEFNVGYQSLTEIAKNLHSIFYRKKNQMVSNTVIRKETLFSKENQEILFTMSQ